MLQWDPIGPKMDPRWSPPWFGTITIRSNFGRNRWPKNPILGHGNFLGFWPNFLPQWDPIGPTKDPRSSLPWFRAITVRSNFSRNRWRKFEFWGMAIFCCFDPFFSSNGTPLAPRWTLGGPHHDLAPKPWGPIFAEIDDHGVVENSNFAAWQFFAVLTHCLAPMGPHWP